MPLRNFSAIAAVLFVGVATAAEPLHNRIDELIDQKRADQPASPAADDAEFLRRVYLDFTGRIPTADVARAFFADKSPTKRTKLIDDLLAGPDYAARMADTFHVMLMERLGDHPEWAKYLTESFKANKPWDQMIREMLRADANAKGASFFLSKRLEHYGQQPVDYSALTRDVGRLFLGKNFQCCECHDHLFIEDYKQQHFQGLHAFFKNAQLVSEKEILIAEKPTTEKTAFASVFTKVQMSTAPAVPGGKMVEIPTFAKGQEFAVLPDRKTNHPGTPKFSTLAAAAAEIPVASNRDFVRNAVNRIWFVLLGRGLVHPLDLSHLRNPASHPELLEMLADEFVAHKFDIKFLLREIALTKTYQRSSLLPSGVMSVDGKLFGTALERRLTAEQLLNSVCVAVGEKPTEALRAKFVKAFANQPRDPEDEITPSLKSALFVLHDEAVLGMTKAKPGNLVERVSKLKDEAIAEEVYLSVLTRKPSADESKMVGEYLKKNGGKRELAIGQLVWALIASMEFGVNH